ncbi:metalloproteinase inhibitor 3-like [Chiloscyllium plagiosum]|uniref:metalloproteinase inhibitor 3-like n=1 Tax=Chiloscyllium plagiosum TaxID=36176 RepID=UPI001CB80596|nr:metalloproteinase inhibitor 3-like [Chiloscyllium plagiosum]XP_043563883.1 metalloproteinase inhibitor 3-like [Chiloscyllium plagiosum]
MNTLVTGLLLSVLTLRLQELVDACTCLPVHPQTAFCNSDIVIRVSVTSKSLVSSNNMEPYTIQYAVKQEKIYEGFEKKKMVEYVYTASSSAACGVELKLSIQYLITGQLDTQGKVHIGICNWIVPWDDLTSLQKRNLKWNKYKTGCSCQIVSCHSLPCSSPAKNQCIWTDLATEKTPAGSQAKYNVCMKRDDGFCHWCGEGSASANENIYYSEP